MAKFYHNFLFLLFLGSANCSIKTVPTVIELEDIDAGPDRILGKIAQAIHEENKDQSVFVRSDNGVENSAFVRKWEGCFVYPKINISLSFTGNY